MRAPRRAVALLVDIDYREMAHEARRRGAVPVVLARLEEHAVAWADHLDRRAAPLYEANAFRDVDRLSVRMGVPRSSRARRESDAARAHARWTRRRRDRVDVRRTREPLARPRGGLDRVLGNPHGSTPDFLSRLFRGPRQSGLLACHGSAAGAGRSAPASPQALLSSRARTRHGHIARDSDMSVGRLTPDQMPRWPGLPVLES